MAATKLYKKFLQGIGLIPKASSENAVLGDLEVLSSNNKLHFHNGTINDPVVTEVDVATLTHKTINGPDNTITNLINANLSGTAAITNANLATMVTATVKGNISGSTGTPSDVPISSIITAGNAITALTGDVSATGPNSVAATVNSVDGSSAANIHSAELLANAATSANTASTIVKRDSSGNFITGTITATLIGTASGNTTYTPNNHGVVISGSGNVMSVIAPDASIVKVLTSGGSSANPTWQNVPAASATITSVSTTYPILTSDGTILCDANGAGFAVTLPTAIGVSGKSYTIKKTDSTFNIVTIATTSSQTIDGVITTTLSTQNEVIILESDGANWQVLDRRFPSNWATYSSTIGGVTTAPTPGAGATFVTRWRRLGDSIEINGEYNQNASSGSSGSGSYLFPIPSGLIINSSKIRLMNVVGNANGAGSTVVGNCYVTEVTSPSASFSAGSGWVMAFDTVNLVLANILSSGGSSQILGSGTSTPLGDPSVYFSFRAILPITNWVG